MQQVQEVVSCLCQSLCGTLEVSVTHTPPEIPPTWPFQQPALLSISRDAVLSHLCFTGISKYYAMLWNSFILLLGKQV